MNALQDRVAIVTGGSKGMGRHFVRALIDAGARVAIFARASAELDSIATDFGDRALAIPCDIALPDQVDDAVARTVARFGRLDFLVNNAAIYHPFPFEEGSDAIIRQHLDVNVLGVAWAIRACIPHLRAAKGQIVTISSESVRMPFPMLALYAGTKAAVEAMSNGLRDELRGDGIRVGILRSGNVSGGSGGDSWSAETKQRFFQKIVETGHASMSGQPASPQSMAQALVAMLSLPADVSIDMIELRAAREGMPAGATAARGPDS